MSEVGGVMSGGAFNYEEFHLLQLRDVIEERRDEELGEDLTDNL